MSRLEEMLSLVKEIPPFPKVAQRVMEMIEDPDVGAKELAKVIQYDQSITANVLKICNSPYYGLGGKISSLDSGLIRIGNEILKEIIITGSSQQFYQGTGEDGYQLADGELWKHSVATAIMAKLLVRHVKGVESGAAFTGGLLHDIGKRIMSKFVKQEFNEIMGLVAENSCTFVEAEQEVLGITHAELGGRILEQWEFPQDLTDAVRQHHDPDALHKEPLSAVVCLSNALVISLGIGIGVSGLAVEIQGEGLKNVGLTNADMDLLMADLIEEMSRAEDMIQLE
ncbi:HDOD domain-containing protein [Thermodesulfobacteriota bacterium]